MDKYEYKVRSDEIKELIAQGDYAQAAEIADTIDWRRVKSVMMLCTISDLYKINRRYEDARDMLLLAYERRPGGRTICYSLCELSIKMEEYLQAIEYYKEFVQIAPKDPGRYILQYKLYEAQDVSLEERIEVLEELKKRDYREKWAYELAYLYHRVGLATRCVEECDELILWFGEGKYVIKAMELKMLHQPLSPEQQEKYDHRFDGQAPEIQIPNAEEEQAEYSGEQDGGNLQSYGGTQGYEAVQDYETVQDYEAVQDYGNTREYPAVQEGILEGEPQEAQNQEAQNQKVQEETRQPEDMDIHVKTMDVGQYNTINLQEELAAGLKEVLGEERAHVQAEAALEPEEEQMESSEVFFGETGEIADLENQAQAQTEPESEPAASFKTVIASEQNTATASEQNTATEPEQEPPVDGEPDVTGQMVMEQMRSEREPVQQVMQAEPPKEMAEVLSQETDGQISFVLPESEQVEKQITGQMNIEDVLAEWERMKKENQEKRKEEVRRHVLQQTGNMFTEFEASVRDGLLEKLEREKADTEEPEVIEETPGEVPEEVSEEAYEEAPEEVSEEAYEEAYEEAPEEVSEELHEEAPEEVSEKAYEEAPEEVSEELHEEAPEEVSEEAYEEASEEVSEELYEEAPEEDAEEPLEEPREPEEILKAVQEEEEKPSRPEVERDRAKIRNLTREEKELYASFIQSKSAREQLVKAIDGISMAPYTGNVIITGEEGMDTLTLAKNMIREVQMTDSNFSGKVAKISGQALNRKNVEETLDHLKNGALIIQKAAGMSGETAKALHKALQKEARGIIVILEDTKKAVDKLLEGQKELSECFPCRMDVEALSNDTLVAFGRKYAREMEYSIDELGILALHTRIEDMQTIDHVVTAMEVKDIVDEAIRHANRKTLGHFLDILFARRYDDEDMIILTEKDFV
ncbi:MAG TPA: hypothetical protein H9742_06300 [Candidatus Acetatifactor stercoripullorum]|uniref:Tetratricopeptide repeat protein n=1 Tax=Candidatus Acetatifactor stercoripullorum TaxID=2838414 RepID=A0A9D1R6U7_9FIRM|nr:hypothetical protein [uncultured Acetatifactor sp.]HIW81131.1 hypothetical protein [Candidatus Acetatifactor stercoripullorum]